MDEFDQLAQAIHAWPRGALPKSRFASRLLERLRLCLHSLRAAPERVGTADVAALVHHVLAAFARRLWAPRTVGWPTPNQWRRAGVEVVDDADTRLQIEAGPAWTPHWLAGAAERPPFDEAFRAVQRRPVAVGPEVRADPCVVDWLGANFAHHLAPGQRQALRGSLLAPTDATLLAVLPTGSGKSLLAWAPALAESRPGVTIVVVPTVALALDQERQLREIVGWPGPLAWHAALAEEDRTLIRRRIRDGVQPVVFTSPEALLTALAPALFAAAQAGLVRALVIDEVHIVAQWGGDFRSQFQLLPAFRDALLRHCPAGRRFRTLLLTATLTADTWETLERLFAPLETIHAVHLRFEPSFWSSWADSADEKRARLLEAIHRSPRPLILYTTRRADAEAWTALLRGEGYRRVDFVHGGTRGELRADVVDRWRARELDVVVATSAFGLGMDLGEVRAVLHACVPEDVDRVYQEVGRGGRDGNACVSLLVYEDADLKDARRLSRERTISIDLGLERWEAMHGERTPVPGWEDVIEVDLTAQRAEVTRDSDENVAWNVRTLVLMARAGLVRLECRPPPDLEPEPGETAEAFTARRDEEFEDYFTHMAVRPETGHLDREAWRRRVEPHRTAIADAGERGLRLMTDILDGQDVGTVLEKAYTVSRLGIYPEPYPHGFPSAVPCRAEDTLSPRLRALGASPIAVIYHELGGSAWQRARWRALVLEVLLPRLVQEGVREIAVGSIWADDADYRRLYRHAPDRYLIHRLPDERDDVCGEFAVPRVTLLDPTSPPAAVPRWLWELERPMHLLLVPADARDPERPGEPLAGHRAPMSLDVLLERLNR